MNLGFPEILMIFIIALLVFGPNKIPELGKGLASLRAWRNGARWFWVLSAHGRRLIGGGRSLVQGHLRTAPGR